MNYIKTFYEEVYLLTGFNTHFQHRRTLYLTIIPSSIRNVQLIYEEILQNIMLLQGKAWLLIPKSATAILRNICFYILMNSS